MLVIPECCTGHIDQKEVKVLNLFGWKDSQMKVPLLLHSMTVFSKHHNDGSKSVTLTLIKFCMVIHSSRYTDWDEVTSFQLLQVKKILTHVQYRSYPHPETNWYSCLSLLVPVSPIYTNFPGYSRVTTYRDVPHFWVSPFCHEKILTYGSCLSKFSRVCYANPGKF